MPGTRPIHIWRIGQASVLAGMMALTGCSRERVNGSSNPPVSFGKVERNWLGCTDISGVYAWPPAEGEIRAHSLSGEKLRGGRNLAPIKLTMPGGEAQIWFSGATGGKRLLVQSRLARADLAARGELSTKWDRDEISQAAFSCRGSWISLDGDTLVGEPDRKNRRETSSEGVRLARLTDGSLAVGQWVRYSGRRDSINIFGAEFAEFAAGDVVSWNWARLARLGDSGNDALTAVKSVPAPPLK